MNSYVSTTENVANCTVEITQYFRPVWLERPERAEALSPGQRPGYKGTQQGAL